jgi:hypothetical protein
VIAALVKDPGATYSVVPSKVAIIVKKMITVK